MATSLDRAISCHDRMQRPTTGEASVSPNMPQLLNHKQELHLSRPGFHTHNEMGASYRPTRPTNTLKIDPMNLSGHAATPKSSPVCAHMRRRLTGGGLAPSCSGKDLGGAGRYSSFSNLRGFDSTSSLRKGGKSFGSSGRLSNFLPNTSFDLHRGAMGSLTKQQNHTFPSSGTVGSTTSSRSSGSSVNVLTANAVMQVAQRSNGSKVKTVIADLLLRCHPGDLKSPPLEPLALLAQWSSVDDAYYKVLITKYNGIPAIVNAMKAYPDSAEAQLYGCSALKNMANKLTVMKAGGLIAVCETLERYQNDISIQSSGWTVVRQLVPLIPEGGGDELAERLRPLLENAIAHLHLTTEGKESATFLLESFAAKKEAPSSEEEPTTAGAD